ncbi:hypothetical protein [Streptomyces sp. XD-27]|uniref:hypothetical protein n=1 Tax=Streptomyces sp. XD-27 TaxID=3062779 RepID=UPI0026F4625E|nr:hypothetical protein [Streptomyces sp. XD-27]WKX69210.1 hypothetical protein Q3Y56_04070 [Streptomyces sp. XD-27]
MGPEPRRHRSRLTGPPGPQRIEDHGHDAHLLMSAVAAGEPAYVFGTSYGGMIGMDLRSFAQRGSWNSRADTWVS